MANAYLYAAFAFLAWRAYLDRSDVRDTFVASLLWPLILLYVAMEYLAKMVGWCFDVAVPPEPRFGFRRPIDGWPGFAVSFRWFELRFWKARR